MKKFIVMLMVMCCFISETTQARKIDIDIKKQQILEILDKYDYKTNKKVEDMIHSSLISKKEIEEYNKVIDKIKKYKLGDYIYLETEINGWVIDDIGQEVAYEYAEGDLVKYILYLTMQYQEGAKNDDECMHYNSDGLTVDVGRTQQNCRIDDIEKIEKMKKPRTNLLNGFYEINEILEECDNNYAEMMISYNGGYKSRDFVRHGIWTTNCQAGKYMQKFFVMVEKVFNAYQNEIEEL